MIKLIMNNERNFQNSMQAVTINCESTLCGLIKIKYECTYLLQVCAWISAYFVFMCLLSD